MFVKWWSYSVTGQWGSRAANLKWPPPNGFFTSFKNISSSHGTTRPPRQRFHRFAVKLKTYLGSTHPSNKKANCPQRTQIKNHSKYTTRTFPTDDNLRPVPANRMGGSQLPAWAISAIKQCRQPWLKERATWIKPIDKRRPPISPEVYF